MKVLIIYDSLYGNTEKIAQSIGQAIKSHREVEVVRAEKVDISALKSVGLLIVGSPTQGGRPTKTLQELLSRIPENALKNVNVASFDTRVSNKFASIFGYAAGRIAKSLQTSGGNLILPPEGFIVNNSKGPLKDGELDRAVAWAAGIPESK
jgi:flavodoxin I